MADVSGIKMTPVDGGDGVDIPSGKTTIGRGTFLQVLLPSACMIYTYWYTYWLVMTVMKLCMLCIFYYSVFVLDKHNDN